MLEILKKEVLKANLELAKYTSKDVLGGISAYESRYGLVVACPDGAFCDSLRADELVVLDINGNVVEGERAALRDIKTHLEIFKAFPKVSCVVSVRSPYALSWAQAKRDIPCYGTAHARYFREAVPCVSLTSANGTDEAFEQAVGKSIAEMFKTKALDPLCVPAALCSCHAAFAWGKTVNEAVINALALESAAKAAVLTEKINPNAEPVGQELLKSFFNNI